MSLKNTLLHPSSGKRPIFAFPFFQQKWISRTTLSNAQRSSRSSPFCTPLYQYQYLFKLLITTKAYLSVLVSTLSTLSNWNSSRPTLNFPTQIENHQNGNGTNPILRMTDEITEGVRKWTLNEMLEPADGAAKKNKKDKAMEWGRPGHLVQQELDVYVSYCNRFLSEL